jgi:hypothetical protein
VADSGQRIGCVSGHVHTSRLLLWDTLGVFATILTVFYNMPSKQVREALNMQGGGGEGRAGPLISIGIRKNMEPEKNRAEATPPCPAT